jgi:hypothetical protein
VGPRAGLDTVEERKIVRPLKNKLPSRGYSPYRGRCHGAEIIYIEIIYFVIFILV